MFLIVAGGALVVLGALRGPRFTPADIDRDIDDVAWAVVNERGQEAADARK